MLSPRASRGTRQYARSPAKYRGAEHVEFTQANYASAIYENGNYKSASGKRGIYREGLRWLRAEEIVKARGGATKLPETY